MSDYSEVFVLSVNSAVDSWVVDSEESFHTTQDRAVMMNYISENFWTVHLANDEQLNVVGYRTTFEDGNWKVVRGATVIAKGQKSDMIVVGEIPVLDVLSSSWEVLRSWANGAALKVRKVLKLGSALVGVRG
ncbi:hypothetical protein LIER_04254 [Lithospermum erythrorhizon]|uniref:Uncharacterized protein n=1 Tax=Lithospermum erythrorhizon TaxID=34254 RepID=A0AAV3NXG0_LITER